MGMLSSKVEGAGEFFDCLQRDVPLAAFDRTDVGAVETGTVSEPLLRESLFPSQSTQFLAKLSCDFAVSSHSGLIVRDHVDVSI